MRDIQLTPEAQQARRDEAEQAFRQAAHEAALEAEASGAGHHGRAIGVGFAAAKLHKTPAQAAALLG